MAATLCICNVHDETSRTGKFGSSSFYKFGSIKKDAHGFGICNMALDVTVG